MIEPGLFLAFVTAVTVLMLIPGPNVALIVANAIAQGPKAGLLTVAGTSCAMIVQLALTSLGLTSMLGALGGWFEEIRWIGALYLVFLGIRQWRAPPIDLTAVPADRLSRRAIFLRALLVSLTNPKTLFFYGALFPQFIAVGQDATGQLLLLSATFLLVAVTVDSGWVLLAARARGFLGRRGRLRNRLSGGFLIGAGVGLAALRGK